MKESDVMGVLDKKLVSAAGSDDAASVDDGDLIAEPLDEIHDMAGEDDGAPAPTNRHVKHDHVALTRRLHQAVRTVDRPDRD